MYPVMLHGDRIDALVAGGGPVAARKAAALLASGARVRLVAPSCCAEVEALAAQHAERLTITRRRVADVDAAGATLVVAATDDRAVNARLAAAARERGVPVNVADAPAEGTFSTAAVHRAGEVVVAVSAGGVPTAAIRVRDAIAECVGDDLAAAVLQLSTLRARLLAADDASSWHRAAGELIGPDLVSRVRAGTFADEVRAWD